MEVEKENMNKSNFKKTSKIPLPVKPLPTLSKHLLKRQHEEEQRPPLKTINCSSNVANTAGSNKNLTKIQVKKNKSTLKVDSRHVTQRPRGENLDWDYKVFKDKPDDNNSIISISDDEICMNESNERKLKFFVGNKTKSCLGESKKVVTPTFKSSLEPSRVRNIKRSLKRPHSRELQGLSPVTKQEKKADGKFKRRLNFNEQLHEILQSPDFWKTSYMVCSERDYTDDIYTYLLNAEDKVLAGMPKIQSITRACVLHWLMKVNGPDGNPAVVQTARWYLDSVLSIRHVQLDKLQLIAAACYWIAQKIHGPMIPAIRLVKCSNRAFTAEELLAAEKAVFYKLNFPQQPVVPQDYITYFAWWCDNHHPGEIEVAATFLCMSGMMVDKSLCGECPSVIAAAAVRNALLLLRRKDIMAKLQLCPVFKIAERKVLSISIPCLIQRKAVRQMSDPLYEYKAPLEFYGASPYNIAQRIVSAANELAVKDDAI